MGHYPLVDVPFLGGGMVIALIALFHVLLAHFAVGAGFLLYAFERRNRDPAGGPWDAAARMVSWVLVHVNFVIGALSGVGIWFAISIFSPDATEHLISRFVWLWATEWVLFALEIAIGYLYYVRRPRLSQAGRETLTLAYALVAWGSLVIITGILSYMLTSSSGGVWASWFNASMIPSVLLRTGSSLCMAAITTMVLMRLPGLLETPATGREELQRLLDRALLVVGLMVPAGLWFRASLPAATTRLAEGQAMVMTLIFMVGAGASALIAAYALWAWLSARRQASLELAVLLWIFAGVTTVAFEFVREGLRKPYLIAGHLYSNGLRVSEIPSISEWVRTQSVLELSPFVLPPGRDLSTLEPAARGEAVFRHQCASCHTLHGFNAIVELTVGWHREDIRQNVPRIHRLKPYMPRFFGSERDEHDLAAYLFGLHDEPGARR